MNDAEDRRGPGLKFPPPLLAIGIIGLGYLVDWFSPLPISTWDLLWLTGIALILLSVIVALIALFHFLEAKTHVEPWHPTTTVIERGLFRYSRNPIYLAFCSTTVGSGLALNSWWIVIGVLPLVYLLQRLVIRHEETYLENKFGKVYLDYKSRVRRWL